MILETAVRDGKVMQGFDSESLEPHMILVMGGAQRYTTLGHKLGIYALHFFVWQSVEPDAIFLPAGEGEREVRRKKAAA